jgi:pimeloyl-ACP methyl ester carboxylesterase
VETDVSAYAEHYLEVDLDHFGIDERTFKMRYLTLKDSSVKDPSAIFFYTGNEGPIDAFWNISGFVRELATRHNAAVIFAEHRYYGKSLPLGEVHSFTRENLRYLSVEQTIADYSALARKVQNGRRIPVIAFGGSYGGWLSAYWRMKYPHVVEGALAASANLALAAGVIGEHAYFSGVTQDFENVNPQCPDLVRAAFSHVATLQAGTAADLASLSSKFNLCIPLKTEDDPDTFLQWLTSAFITVTQLDYPYPVAVPGVGFPAAKSCSLMLGSSSPIDGLAAILKLVYGGACQTISDNYVLCADQTGCGPNGTMAWAWDYQCCSENFALGTTMTNVSDMFPPRPWGQAELTKYCENRWGITPKQSWVGLNFGTSVEDWKHFSNIIFSNGLLDPFHIEGILQVGSCSVVLLLLIVDVTVRPLTDSLRCVLRTSRMPCQLSSSRTARTIMTSGVPTRAILTP